MHYIRLPTDNSHNSKHHTENYNDPKGSTNHSNSAANNSITSDNKNNTNSDRVKSDGDVMVTTPTTTSVATEDKNNDSDITAMTTTGIILMTVVTAPICEPGLARGVSYLLLWLFSDMPGQTLGDTNSCPLPNLRCISTCCLPRVCT